MIAGDNDDREIDPVTGHDADGYEHREESPLAESPEELELADEEERLPWLESADYDDDVSSNDTGRLIGFALLGLLAVALVIGTVWWLSNRGPDPDLAADGSTITAPAGDYKERPENPGGKTFEGTGDVAPAVGEGQTREGRLADDVSDDPRPSIDTARSDSAGTASGTASATGGVGVQVGAYSTRDGAVAGWNALQRQTEALAGFKYRIEQGTADIGTVYRLQAVAGDAAAANTLCSALKSDGVACQVKR